MNRPLIAAVVIAVAGGTMFARAQQPSPPQERQFTLTLTERDILYIGSLLDEQKVKDAAPITNKIQGQIGQQMQQAAAQAQNNAEKSIRDRISADAAKAAEDKAKADGAAKATEPEKPK